MQLSIPYKEKWIAIAGLVVLLASVGAVFYTESFLFLPIPFVFLYGLLMGLNWKTAYWMLLALVPISIQISFNNDTGQLTLPDEPMQWLFLGLFILIWARRPNLIPQWWWRNPLVFIIVLQFLWFIVAVIFSHVLFFSIKYLIAKTWMLVCYFILPLWVFRTKKDFITGFKVTFIPILLSMVVIMVHYSMFDFKFDKIQWALTWLYYNHVDYSSVVSMFLPLVWVAWRLVRKQNKKQGRWLFWVLIFFIPTIYFAYARAAYIAVVFSIAVALAIRYRLANLIMPAIYVLMIVTIAYMVNNDKYIDFRPNFDQTYMHHDFADHMIATFRGRDMSSMERLYRWIAGVRMSRDQPITGYGPHAFYYYYKPYAVSIFKTWVSKNTEHSTTHNYFLYMLVEQGWPAMLLYALLLIVIFARAQVIYHRFTDPFYKLVTLGLAMTIASGFINNFFSELIDTHKVGALFYIPISLLVILDKKSKNMQRQSEAMPLPPAD
jgi:O-antigen ligase